jgi:hypothetical protein
VGLHIFLYLSDISGQWVAYGHSAYALRLYVKAQGYDSLRAFTKELNMPCTVVSHKTVKSLRHELKIIDEQGNDMVALEVKENFEYEKYLMWMEKLQKENSTLRGSDEKRRQEIISLEQQRDGYREKYQEQKNKNNLLNSKLAEIEEDFRNIMKERENEQSLKLKEEELKRMKLDSKAKIVSELQNRIQNYKNERLKKKSEDV